MANKLIKFPDSSLSPVVFYINKVPHVYDNSGMLVRIDTQPTNVKTLALKFRGNYNLPVYDYPEGMTIDELKRDLFVGSVILDDKGKLFHTTSVNSRLQLGENIIAMTLPYSTKYDSDNLAGYPYLINTTFVVLDKDNQVHTYQGGHFIKPPKEEGDVRKLTFDKKVVDSYSLGNRLFTVLKTDDNELYMWQPLHKGRKSQYKDILYKIPGKEIKNISHSILYDESVPIYYTDAFLTDEGLFHIARLPQGNKNIHSYLNESPSFQHSIYKKFAIYPVDLPEKVTPDDIKQIISPPYNNLFLLTNDGEVYAIGKNTYCQRGTNDTLDPFVWNKIKYPDKIDRIECARPSPGLFAISESGDLYYHGYNENARYEFTGRKTNIAYPRKVKSNVSHILCSSVNILLIDKKGIPLSFPESSVGFHDSSKFTINTPALHTISKSKPINKSIIHGLLQHIC